MVKLQISQKDVLLVVMDFLREHNMMSSLIAIEKESQVFLYKYSKEIQFLRNQILDGQWADADVFIKTIFENSSPFYQIAVNDNGKRCDEQARKQNQINYHIKKQIYLELLFTNDLENNQNYVVDLVKEMEVLSPSKEAHFEICNLLNYPRL